MRKLLDDSDRQERLRAADIIWNFAIIGGHPLSARSPTEIENFGRILIPSLLSHFDDSDPNVRSRSIGALLALSLRPEAVVPGFTTAFQNAKNNSEIRTYSAAFLGTYRSNATTAVPALLKALGEPDSDIRRAAGDALKKIAPEEAVKAGVE